MRHLTSHITDSHEQGQFRRAILAGLIAALVVLAITCVSGLTLYLRSCDALRSEVRDNLMRTATAAAALVDGDAHRQFVSPAQEASAPYRRAIDPLERILKSSEDIKFVYTCVLVKNQVFFVLDPTPPGTDVNGVDQKSHIMQLYPDATAAMVSALRTGRPQADAEPSSDQWGTFISGYAPILDSRNRQVGVVGVDLTADRYVARLTRMRRAAEVGLTMAVTLAGAVGLFVFSAQRKQERSAFALQDAHDTLEAQNEELTAMQDELLCARDKLEDRVAVRTKELTAANTALHDAYNATIEGWSRVLDLRDHETEGHCQRVTDLTLRLAEAFRFAGEQLVHVRRGALLHDIGKIGVPDAILLKPGPLTDQEWVLMRQHPRLAYEMLSPIGFLHPALDIPYAHHEKWDGSGYPRRLKGEAIPLSARLFAVVDVWDALSSDRPYRRAWPEQKTRAHIQSLAGTHFDPDVVAAFLEIVLPDIRKDTALPEDACLRAA